MYIQSIKDQSKLDLGRIVQSVCKCWEIEVDIAVGGV